MSLAESNQNTLGVWLRLTLATMGEGKAADFLRKKIGESPDGENEEVIAPESQLLALLAQLQYG